MKKRGIPAYMTVEASFIVPFTVICFIIIIFFTFFLYDHMLVYQSCYLSALRGSQLKNTTDDAVEAYVKKELEKLEDNLIYQYGINNDVRAGALGISVESRLSIENRMYRFNLYKEEEIAGQREVSINRTDPVSYIRNADRFR